MIIDPSFYHRAKKLEVNGTVKANTIAVARGNQYNVLKTGAGWNYS
ncbi:hypothetical protein [Ferruginibacter sp. HRS2-29]|nr:hypothetical protein [Ferruginibacter sp. HRS2-29]